MPFFYHKPYIFNNITNLLAQNSFKYEYYPKFHTVFKEGKTKLYNNDK